MDVSGLLILCFSDGVREREGIRGEDLGRRGQGEGFYCASTWPLTPGVNGFRGRQQEARVQPDRYD